MIELRAVLHVHTSFSDGSMPAEEVVRTASGAGVDVLGINDHWNLAAREAGLGGMHDGMLVMAGAELSAPDESNHLLVYGVDRLPETGDTAGQVRRVREAGGLPIIAHPREEAPRLYWRRAYVWEAGALPGVAGVEVWNYMASWKGGLRKRDVPAALLAPDGRVRHPSDGAIALWRRTGGCITAGPDAHGFRFGAGPLCFRVFPYRMLFARLATHILLDRPLSRDGRESEERVIDALSEGRCFVANRRLGDARGFRVERLRDRFDIFLPGAAEVSLEDEEGERWSGRMPEGRGRIEDRTDGPVTVRLGRGGRTWILAGIG